MLPFFYNYNMRQKRKTTRINHQLHNEVKRWCNDHDVQMAQLIKQIECVFINQMYNNEIIEEDDKEDVFSTNEHFERIEYNKWNF